MSRYGYPYPATEVSHAAESSVPRCRSAARLEPSIA
jgi:hypothetical protein